MKYTIKLTNLAKKMLTEITDQRIKIKIGKRIDKLTTSPEQQGKSLKGGLSGYRSIRAVGQRYRIVYKIEREGVIVYIIGIGIRKEGGKGDVYAQLKKMLGKIQ